MCVRMSVDIMSIVNLSKSFLGFFCPTSFEVSMYAQSFERAKVVARIYKRMSFRIFISIKGCNVMTWNNL